MQNAYVLLLFLGPRKKAEALINYYLAGKDVEHLSIILLCSLVLSWLITAVLAYERMINSPEYLLVQSDRDTEAIHSFDEKFHGISLICTTTTRAVELYSPQLHKRDEGIKGRPVDREKQLEV